MSKYQLRLRPGFPAATRHRAGVEIRRTPEGVTVELTAEQLAAIQADAEIVVREIKASSTAASKKMVDEPAIAKTLKTSKPKKA